MLKKKITIEIDSDDKPFYEIARKSWINHLLRNESIIVDNFHGNYFFTFYYS